MRVNGGGLQFHFTLIGTICYEQAAGVASSPPRGWPCPPSSSPRVRWGRRGLCEEGCAGAPQPPERVLEGPLEAGAEGRTCRTPGWSLCPSRSGPKGLRRTMGPPSTGCGKAEGEGRRGRGVRPLPLNPVCLPFLQGPQGRHGAQEVALALPLTQLQVSHFTSWCLSLHTCCTPGLCNTHIGEML